MNKIQHFNHAYLDILGNKYYDYEAATDRDYWYWNDDEYLFSDNIFKEFRTLDSFADKTIKPKKGSSLYLFPGGPVALDDIRRNYTIKKKIDTGDYNVIHPYESNSYRSWKNESYFNQVAVFPSEKKIFLHQAPHQYGNTARKDVYSEAEMYKYACECFGSVLNREDMVYLENFVKDIQLVRGGKNMASYVSLLTTPMVKPLVSIENLDLNAENELNLDVLMLVYSAAKSTANYREREENMLVQLNVMNNYNWREYPRTVSILLNEVGRYHLLSDMKRHPSQYSKTIREILEHSCNEFASEKDYLLSQKLLNALLNIGDGKFVSFDTLDDRLHQKDIPRGTFLSMFTDIVKVMPKKYDENNDKKED